jgi:hypothetical protein
LLWALQEGTRPKAFRAERTVNEDGHSTMCVDDPGFEVDLYVAVSLRDMI